MRHVLRAMAVVALGLLVGLLTSACCGEGWDDGCYYVGWDPYYGDIWQCKPDAWDPPGAALETGLLDGE